MFKQEKTLLKRATAKAISYAMSEKLMQLPSPLQSRYKSTHFCCHYLKAISDKLVGIYCKQRFCIVCNRIRTAKYMKSYLPILESFSDAHFLTITVPNCDQFALKKVLSDLYTQHRTFLKYCQKRKIKIQGIRKVEITYNARTNTYHPHLHIIIDSKQNGYEYLMFHVEHNKEAKSFAQDIRPASEASVKELLKYFAKLFKQNADGSYEVDTPAYALDTIFKSVDGTRIIQPFGFKAFKSEEEETEVEKATIENIEKDCTSWAWNQRARDWVQGDGEARGQLLHSCTIDKQIDKFINNIEQKWQ